MHSERAPPSIVREFELFGKEEGKATTRNCGTEVLVSSTKI
jgi:hypothetical protein